MVSRATGSTTATRHQRPKVSTISRTDDEPAIAWMGVGVDD